MAAVLVSTPSLFLETGMEIERRIVNNRVFLLGLDQLYRQAMKRHEANELLRCARETASALSVAPARVPIEGYYSEDTRLTEYFRLMRELQQVPKERESAVAGLTGFQRLRQVTESPLFGRPVHDQFLLALGEDALSVALKTTFPDWSVENLTQRAYECATDSSDFSLVGLAPRRETRWFWPPCVSPLSSTLGPLAA
jgi:hypothetical protein